MQKGERSKKVQEILDSNPELKEKISELKQKNLSKKLLEAETKKLLAEYGIQTTDKPVCADCGVNGVELSEDELVEVIGGKTTYYSCNGYGEGCGSYVGGKCHCSNRGSCWICYCGF